MSYIKLEDSESLYRQLVELSPDAIFIAIEGTIIYINPSGVKLFGATSHKELVGSNVINLIHPDYREIVAERIRHLRDEKSPVPPLEEKYLRLDGSVIDVEVSAAPFLIKGRAAAQVIVRDITKRKRAERSLAEQFQFLQLLIDTIPSPIFYKDSKGVYLGCIQSMAEFLGRPKEAIIGKTVFDVYPQEQAEKYFQMDQDLFQHPGTQIYETVMEGANNNIRDFISSKATFIDSSGQIAGLIGVMTDITERKQAEGAVAAERQRFFSLLEAMPAFVGLLTPDYDVAFANRYFRERFGEPEGRRCYDYMFGRSEPCENCQALKVLETNKEDYEWLGPDGGTYQICDQLVHDIDGSPLILEMGIDITEHKKMEQALSLREQEYRTLVENIPLLIVRYDTDLHRIYVNPAWEKASGLSGADVINKRAADITQVPEPVVVEYEEKLRQVLETGSPQTIEFTWVNARGETLFLEYAIVPEYDRQGNIISVLAVGRDQTERKRAEEEIRAAAQKWRTTFDAISDAVFLMDRQCRIIQCNQALADLVRKPLEEIIGRTCWELIHGTSGPIENCPVMRLWESRRRETLTLPQGDRWLYAKVDPIFDEAGEITGAVHAISDITNYYQAMQQIQNLNTLLRATKNINEAFLRIKNEKQLFQHTCDQLVGIPYVRFAWVGLVEPVNFEIKPVAWAGHEESYLSSIKVTWDDSSHGQGPGGRSIKTHEPAVINDIESDPHFLPWRNEALKRGYAAMVALPLLYDKEPLGAIMVYSGTKHAFQEEEFEFLKQVASDIAVGIKSLRLEQEVIQNLIKVQITMMQTVESIATMAELRDPYTAGHQRRVTRLACALAQEMNLSENTIECIRVAGFLHDIGKIVVPAEILSKPGQLSAYELQMIRIHPQAGYDILKKIDFPWPVAQIVLQHHERINGSGYPQGLKGPDILQEAKILAVADVMEAMAAHRPYRPALGIEAALEEINGNKGVLYDPEVVNACVILFTEHRFGFEG